MKVLEYSKAMIADEIKNEIFPILQMGLHTIKDAEPVKGVEHQLPEAVAAEASTSVFERDLPEGVASTDGIGISGEAAITSEIGDLQKYENDIEQRPALRSALEKRIIKRFRLQDSDVEAIRSEQISLLELAKRFNVDTNSIYSKIRRFAAIYALKYLDANQKLIEDDVKAYALARRLSDPNHPDKSVFDNFYLFMYRDKYMKGNGAMLKGLTAEEKEDKIMKAAVEALVKRMNESVVRERIKNRKKAGEHLRRQKKNE